MSNRSVLNRLHKNVLTIRKKSELPQKSFFGVTGGRPGGRPGGRRRSVAVGGGRRQSAAVGGGRRRSAAVGGRAGARACRIIWTLPQKISFGSETCKIEPKHNFFRCIFTKHIVFDLQTTFLDSLNVLLSFLTEK